MEYDVIIIGTGPAGYTAGIYSLRSGLSVLIIGEKFGGTLSEAAHVENYPGFEAISGPELMQKMYDQVLKLGAKLEGDIVKEIKKEENLFKVITFGGEFIGKTLIIATGTKKLRLNLNNERKFTGRGISYCTTCDGPMYKEKTVAVIGGAFGALMSSEYLENFKNKVYLIARHDIHGEKVVEDRVLENKNIEILRNTEVIELIGENKLEKIKVKNNETNEERKIELDGIFVEIGATPVTELVKSLGVEVDEKGFIKVAKDQSTNIKGIFAAGDITTNSNFIRQVSCAIGEATVAALSVYDYLKKLN